MAPEGHFRSDMRNLHLHRAALAKIRAQPELREACLALLHRWLAQPEQRPSLRYLEQWREMLTDWSDEQVAALVLHEDAGQALRQCSPLGPALTARERWRLLDEINHQIAVGESP